MTNFWPVIFYIFTGLIFLNCCFYAYFGRFCFGKAEKRSLKNTVQPPLSILVCARNEAQNLIANVPFLLEQRYSDFEILLINDASTDETAAVIDDFVAKHHNIRAIHIYKKERAFSGKKYALTKAIAAAKYEHLLFMDADCRPNSIFWAQEMALGFDSEKEIVLGYGSYAFIAHSWLNKVIRFETVLTAIQYFGYAKNGNAYMAVGRNLGYTKTVFYKQNGFSAHENIPSGDDDLFVNAAATSTNVYCVFSPKSFSISKPKTSWTEWFFQKRRHIFVANRYKKKHQFSLGLFYISQFLPYVLLIFLLFSPIFSTLSLFIFLMRYLIVGAVLYAGMDKLKEKQLIQWFPALEFVLVLVQLSIFILSITARSTPWKNN